MSLLRLLDMVLIPFVANALGRENASPLALGMAPHVPEQSLPRRKFLAAFGAGPGLLREDGICFLRRRRGRLIKEFPAPLGVAAEAIQSRIPLFPRHFLALHDSARPRALVPIRRRQPRRIGKIVLQVHHFGALAGAPVSNLRHRHRISRAAILAASPGVSVQIGPILLIIPDAEEHGATFAFNTSVVGGHVSENGIHLHISDTKDMHTYVCDPHAPAQIVLIPKTLINSAGLCASSLARRFHGLPSQAIPNVYYARGCYFTLSESGKAPFSHLIYPVPEDGGLGVHVTLDMGGQVRFGPDVEWLTDIDNTSCFLNMFEYTVDANRAQTFYPEIRKYYPGLRDGALRPDYAGIRSKLSGPGEPAADFIIQGKETHGIFGLVNLFGIESPGLTASMAIAKIVSIIVSQS